MLLLAQFKRFALEWPLFALVWPLHDSFTSALPTEQCRIIVANEEQREVSHTRILHMIRSGSLYIRQFSNVVPALYCITNCQAAIVYRQMA